MPVVRLHFMHTGDVLTPLLSFLGALIGSWVAYQHLRGSRRARLDEAYAELGGAVTVLDNLSVPSLFDARSTQPRSDDAWARFGTARTRVTMIEDRPECRHALDELTQALTDLFSVEVRLAEGGEAVTPSKEEQALAHLDKQKRVQWLFDDLVTRARR